MTRNSKEITANPKSATPRDKAQKIFKQKMSVIEKKISNYDKLYFINYCLREIQKINTKSKKEFSFEFVWIKAIKLVANSKGGKRRPTNKEIIHVINMIWGLNDCIIPFLDANENPLVAMRAMILQQFTFQHNPIIAASDIMRQLIILAEHAQLDEQFKNETGISIAAYCLIWITILNQIISEDCGSTEINLMEIMSQTESYISKSDLYKFFKTFSLSPAEIPGFLDEFTKFDTEIESLYYDSPLKQKPFIFTGTGLRTASNKLATASASFLLPHILKDRRNKKIADKFKAIFTNGFESYIGLLLTNTGVKHLDENEIKDLYRSLGHSGKTTNVVDHILILEDHRKILMVECKGIEQTDFVKTILTPDILQERLSDSYIKGIFQSQICQAVLSNSTQYKHFEFYAIIVINDEYTIGSAEQLRQMIGEKQLSEQKYPIDFKSSMPLEQIRYVRIDVLENLCTSLQNGEYSLDDFLEQSKHDQYKFSLEKLHSTLTKSKTGFTVLKMLNPNHPSLTSLKTTHNSSSPSTPIRRARDVQMIIRQLKESKDERKFLHDDTNHQ